MPVTRINNNQISDASAGNAYVGINAAAKLQDYSITSGKIANSLTYGSDLTVAGNLTVQGNTTTIDTVNVVVEDPLLLLAAAQTGSPTLDIGFIGKRGTSDNVAFVWDENVGKFVTAFTSSEVTNTTITVTSYASFQTLDADVTGNLAVTGISTLTGNVTLGNLFVDGQKTIDVGNSIIGNLQDPVANSDAATKGFVLAQAASGFDVSDGANTQTVAGGDTLYFRGTANEIDIVVSATDNVTVGLTANVTIENDLTIGGETLANGNILAATANTYTIGNASHRFTDIYLTGQSIYLGNVTLKEDGIDNFGNPQLGLFDGATSNAAAVTAAGVSSDDYITAVGNISGGNIATTDGLARLATGGNVYGGNVETNDGLARLSTGGNVYGGNVQTNDGSVQLLTGGLVTATGNVSGANLVAGGGNIILAGGTGNITGSNMVLGGGNINITSTGNINGGIVVATGNVTGGNVIAVGGVTSVTVNATANIVGGNLSTAGVVTATGNVTGGNIDTGGQVVATGAVTAGGNVTGANLSTSGVVIATGNVTGGNVIAVGGVTSVTVNATANISGGNLISSGIIVATGNVQGGNLLTLGGVFATGNVEGSNLIAGALIGDGTDLNIYAAPGGDHNVILNAVGNGTVDVNNTRITSVSDPVNDGDAATKGYVDAVAQGLDIKASVVAATAAALPAFTYNNGSSGVGATITANANGALSIDGVTPSAGDRVLIKNETTTNAPYNGIYVVTTVGDGSTAFVLTRSTDFDNGTPSGEIPGAFTFVEQGTVNADSGWVCTTDAPVTVGTTDITFQQFSGGGSIIAGAGLGKTGNELFVNVDNDTTAIVADAVVVKAGANLVTPNIGNATGTTLTLTGNVVAGNLNSNAAITAATSITATGNVNGGNVISLGIVSATGNITGGNVISVGVVEATGNVTGGNLVTAGDVSGATLTISGNVSGGNLNTAGKVVATGNVEGGNLVTANGVNAATVTATGNVAGGNITTAGDVTTVTVTATGNVSGGNLLTGGVVTATGNITGGNVITLGDVSGATGTFSGNISAGNISTTGQFSVQGNITGGNLLTPGVVEATGNVQGGNLVSGGFALITGNVTGGNLITAGAVEATGNVSGGNVTTAGVVTATGNVTGGNLITAGDVSGATLTISGNVSGGNVTTAGVVTATGNVTGGNLITAGAVEATGNVSGGNVTTAGIVSATGNVEGGNLITAGAVEATGNVSGGNISTTGIASLGNIVISGDDVTGTNGVVTFNSAGADVDFVFAGDTDANLLVLDAGTDTVNLGTATPVTGVKLQVASTDSILVPVGNTAQRPATGVTGMVRFNTTTDALEFYDSNGWTPATSEFTVITADSFTGDGSTTAFTLSAESTTAGTIVAINGVVQIPTVAYSVSGTTLTFTEAPDVSDIIDARVLTTTSSVGELSGAGGATFAASSTAASFDVTGNLIPTANITYNLGNATNAWNDLYLAGNTIYLGPLRLEAADANTFVVLNSSGQQANIDVGAVDVSAITSGTTAIGITAPNGNAYVTVGGQANKLVVTTSGANVAGTLDVTGNVTAGNLSGTNIVGTLTTAAQTNITSVGTLGSLAVTGNISGGNLVATNIGGTLTTAAQTNITSVGTLGSLSVTGNITSGNLTTTNIAGTITTASQTQITAVGTLGSLTVTGNVSGGNLSGTNIVGTLTTAAQTNITSVGTLGSLSVTGNVSTGNVSGTNGTFTNVSGNGSALSALNGANISTGTIDSARISGSYTGITGTGALNAGSITSGFGSIDIGTDTVTCGGLINANANGVGNIGSSTTYFNTVFAKATSAQYADLAEMYEADAAIEPGTVVCFGGDKEVQVCLHDEDTAVAGVISTNPSYIMNSAQGGEHVVAVAFTGRVPCKVVGPVKKGDLMVSAGNGAAKAKKDPKVGTVIGKALADFDGAEGVIEVVVGRF